MLPGWAQEINNKSLYSPIRIRELEVAIKAFLQRERHVRWLYRQVFFQSFKEKITPILCQLSQMIEKKNLLPADSIRSVQPCY